MGPLLPWSVGTSGLSAGAAAALELDAAAPELEAAAFTVGVGICKGLLNADGAAILAGGFFGICGTLADELDDLRADDDDIEPPLIVVGTFSLSLDEIDTAAPLALLGVADLPLGCVIDLAGPGMASALELGFLAFFRGGGSGLAGTGMCPDDDEADGVPVPIFTLIGTAGVGGCNGFAFGTPFGCITGVVSLPRDLDLGAFGALGGGAAFGTIGLGVGGINGFGYPFADGLMLWWKG